MFSIPVYVIGIEDRYRGEELEIQLTAAGIEFGRVPGVVGQYKDVAVEDYADQAAAEEVIGRHLTPGEIGCALAHRSVYERVLQQKDAWALVLEDDARLLDPTNLDRAIQDVCVRATQVPTILMLYAGGVLADETVRRWADHFSISRLLLTPNATTAYVINRPAMELLLRDGLPVISPADWPTRSEGGIEFLCAFPFPFGHDSRFSSTIAGPGPRLRRGVIARLIRKASILTHINWMVNGKYWKSYRTYWRMTIIHDLARIAMGSKLSLWVPHQSLDLPLAPRWLSTIVRIAGGDGPRQQLKGHS